MQRSSGEIPKQASGSRISPLQDLGASGLNPWTAPPFCVSISSSPSSSSFLFFSFSSFSSFSSSFSSLLSRFTRISQGLLCSLTLSSCLFCPQPQLFSCLCLAENWHIALRGKSRESGSFQRASPPSRADPVGPCCIGISPKTSNGIPLSQILCSCFQGGCWLAASTPS